MYKSNLRGANQVLMAVCPEFRGKPAETFFTVADARGFVAIATDDQLAVALELWHKDGLVDRRRNKMGANEYRLSKKGRDVMVRIARIVDAVETSESVRERKGITFRETILTLCAADPQKRKDHSGDHWFTLAQVVEGSFRKVTERNKLEGDRRLRILVRAGLIAKGVRQWSQDKTKDAENPVEVFQTTDEGRAFVEANH